MDWSDIGVLIVGLAGAVLGILTFRHERNEAVKAYLEYERKKEVISARDFVYSLSDRYYDPRDLDKDSELKRRDKKNKGLSVPMLISAYHSFGLMIERYQLPRWIFKKTATGASIIRTYEVLEPYIVYRRNKPGSPSPLYANHFEDLYNLMKKYLERPKEQFKLHNKNRKYNDDEIGDDVLNEIISAGEHAPNGHVNKNSDEKADRVRCIILSGSKKDYVEDLMLDQCKKMKLRSEASYPSDERIRGQITYERDYLFHGAPAVILLISESETNARLACLHMEWRAKEKWGAGEERIDTFRVHLVKMLANRNETLLSKLEIDKNEKVCICLEIGHTVEAPFDTISEIERKIMA